MTEQVFVTGLALHAYHGVMQHEAKVGQTFQLDLVLDIDLAGLALRQARGYRRLRPGGRGREPGVLRPRYRLVEAAAGAVAEAVLERSRGSRRAGDGAQAARADRGDLRRCRRDHRGALPQRLMAEALRRARRQCRRRARDARSGGGPALRRRRGAAARPLFDYRTPPWGVADQPPFVNLCIAVETHLTPQRCWPRARGRARASAATAPASAAGARARSISTSSPMTISRWRAGADAAAPAPVRARLRAGAARRDRAGSRTIAGVRVHDALARVDRRRDREAAAAPVV